MFRYRVPDLVITMMSNSERLSFQFARCAAELDLTIFAVVRAVKKNDNKNAVVRGDVGPGGRTVPRRNMKKWVTTKHPKKRGKKKATVQMTLEERKWIVTELASYRMERPTPKVIFKAFKEKFNESDVTQDGLMLEVKGLRKLYEDMVTAALAAFDSSRLGEEAESIEIDETQDPPSKRFKTLNRSVGTGVAEAMRTRLNISAEVLEEFSDGSVFEKTTIFRRSFAVPERFLSTKKTKKKKAVGDPESSTTTTKKAKLGGAVNLSPAAKRNLAVEQLVTAWARDVGLQGLSGHLHWVVFLPQLRLKFLKTVEDEQLRNWLEKQSGRQGSHFPSHFENAVLAVVDEAPPTVMDLDLAPGNEMNSASATSPERVTSVYNRSWVNDPGSFASQSKFGEACTINAPGVVCYACKKELAVGTSAVGRRTHPFCGPKCGYVYLKEHDAITKARKCRRVPGLMEWEMDSLWLVFKQGQGLVQKLMRFKKSHSVDDLRILLRILVNLVDGSSELTAEDFDPEVQSIVGKLVDYSKSSEVIQYDKEYGTNHVLDLLQAFARNQCGVVDEILDEASRAVAVAVPERFLSTKKTKKKKAVGDPESSTTTTKKAKLGGAVNLSPAAKRNLAVEQLVTAWARDVGLQGLSGHLHWVVFLPQLRLKFLKTVEDEQLRNWLEKQSGRQGSHFPSHFENAVLAVVDEAPPTVMDLDLAPGNEMNSASATSPERVTSVYNRSWVNDPGSFASQSKFGEACTINAPGVVCYACKKELAVGTSAVGRRTHPFCGPKCGYVYLKEHDAITKARKCRRVPGLMEWEMDSLWLVFKQGQGLVQKLMRFKKSHSVDDLRILLRILVNLVDGSSELTAEDFDPEVQSIVGKLVDYSKSSEVIQYDKEYGTNHVLDLLQAFDRNQCGVVVDDA